MEPEQIETARLGIALNKVHNIEEYMRVLRAALKARGFIDARIALRETERLVQVLNELVDEMVPPRLERRKP